MVFLIQFQVVLLSFAASSKIYTTTLRYIRQAYFSFLETLDQVFSTRNVAQFIKGLVIALIIWTLAKLILIVIRFSVKRWMLRGDSAAGEGHRSQRIRTIGTVILNLSKYGIIIIAVLLTLKGFDVNLTAILAGAGVAGLILGFGAQTLVRDVIAGFFLLFEGDIAVGDEISVNGQVGVVEYIGVRVTKVRQFNGELRIVPNGELSNFGNLNRGYMKAVIQVSLAYEQDPEKAMTLVSKLAGEFYTEQADLMLDEPVVQGITQFGQSGIDIRILFKTKPGLQYQMERDFRLILKKQFDTAGIDIPFQRQVVYLKNTAGN